RPLRSRLSHGTARQGRATPCFCGLTCPGGHHTRLAWSRPPSRSPRTCCSAPSSDSSAFLSASADGAVAADADGGSTTGSAIVMSRAIRSKLLRGRSQQLAGTLSGGQQQLVVIGRALMSRPPPRRSIVGTDGAG